jgi:anti-sigma factor RsiW
MKCQEVTELLSDYLDGELDAGRKPDMDSHLATCERCQRELRELRATVSMVSSLPKAPAPTDLADAVIERAATEQPVIASAPRWRVWRLWPAALAAAAAVLIAIQLAPKHEPAKEQTEWKRLESVSLDEAARFAKDLVGVPSVSTSPEAAMPAAKSDVAKKDDGPLSGVRREIRAAPMAAGAGLKREAPAQVESQAPGERTKDRMDSTLKPAKELPAEPHLRITTDKAERPGSLRQEVDAKAKQKSAEETPPSPELQAVVSAPDLDKARKTVEEALSAMNLKLQPVPGQPDTYRIAPPLSLRERTVMLANIAQALRSSVGKGASVHDAEIKPTPAARPRRAAAEGEALGTDAPSTYVSNVLILRKQPSK